MLLGNYSISPRDIGGFDILVNYFHKKQLADLIDQSSRVFQQRESSIGLGFFCLISYP